MKTQRAHRMKKSFTMASLLLLVFMGSTAWDAPEPEPIEEEIVALQEAVPVMRRASSRPASSMKGTFLLAD